MSGPTNKSLKYSGGFANVNGNTKDIGVLCHWYKPDENKNNFSLISMEKHGYIQIKNYLCTISEPEINDDGLVLNEKIFQKIKHLF